MTAKSKKPRCGAIISLGDDQGDNSCTFRCQRTPGHTGRHRERFEHKQADPNPEYPDWVPPLEPGKVTITWQFDTRVTCPVHGLQQSTSCRPCWDALMAWEEAGHQCQKCGGYCLSITDNAPCDACQGTGYVSPEDQAAVLRGDMLNAEVYKKTNFPSW